MPNRKRRGKVAFPVYNLFVTRALPAFRVCSVAAIIHLTCRGFLLALTPAAPINSPSSIVGLGQVDGESHTPVHFESDSLEYQELKQVIVASGNVKVQQSSYTFFSDHAVFNIPEKSLEAWGLVRFSDLQGNTIRARFLTYTAGKGSAQLVDTEGSFGPWVFSAKKVTRDENGNFFLEKARLSTCEMDLSKYHLYGHRIKIFPQKRLTVQHALFRLGSVPILYLPYYYYSLGEKHLAFQIFPGSNQSEGAFVRTVWGYPLTDETYLKVYLDYLSNRGIGTGGEADYYFGEKAKGSLYGFRIFDRLSNRERWNARLFHWQRLSPSSILQISANRLSDDTFPNDFFREDFNRVVREFNSSLALTYQKKNIFFRLFSERSEEYDVTNREFFPAEILVPKLEFSQMQSQVGLLGVEKIVSASFSNRFAGKSSSRTVLNRQYRSESDFQFSLLRRFAMGYKTTLVPEVTFKNQWTNHPQDAEFGEESIQRMELGGNLRHEIGNFWDLDFTYVLADRFQSNRGDDQGREKHALSFLSLIRPKEWFSFRFETEHNLPRYKGESLTFLERRNYQPLRGEISIMPKNDLEFFFREEYTLFDPLTGSKHPLSTQSEILWGQRAQGGNYFAMGTSYFPSRDNVLELRHSARISPNDTWRLEGTLRTLLFYRDLNVFNANRAELIEKELLVRKEWRCWELSFTFRERAGVVEFLFNLELKLERLTRQKSTRVGQESEWYPWRGWQ